VKVFNMKRELLAILCFSISVIANAQPGTKQISIIPQPVSMLTGSGSFKLPASLSIVTDNNPEIKRIAGFLSNILTTATGKQVIVKEGSGTTSQSIFLYLVGDKSIPKEGYRLRVEAQGISITGGDAAGVFYGVQTIKR
jgi:hexosaminidase